MSISKENAVLNKIYAENSIVTITNNKIAIEIKLFGLTNKYSLNDQAQPKPSTNKLNTIAENRYGMIVIKVTKAPTLTYFLNKLIFKNRFLLKYFVFFHFIYSKFKPYNRYSAYAIPI